MSCTAGTPYLRTREMVFAMGVHLEGCVKDLCGVTGYGQPESFRTGFGFLPLGRLVQTSGVKKRLGKSLCDILAWFCQRYWNPAKHDYPSGSPDPMITLADAVGCYFLARALGVSVLRAAWRL